MTTLPPSYNEQPAKSLTRAQGFTDPWFLGRYGMNLYRGCEHGCLYCDGRSERYYVAGAFERDIVVKTNAVELFRAESRRFREPGFVFLGGGVSDSYQPAEAKYCLARGILEVVLERALPVVVLTKSARMERDFDLLAEIHKRSQAIVCISLQTLDDDLRAQTEPGAASVTARLQMLERARALGLATGVMAMPVLPGLSDQPEAIDALVAAARDHGAQFVLAGGLTLRPGAQMQAFFAYLQDFHRQLQPGYQRLYRERRLSGSPDVRYLTRVDERFRDALDRHRMPGRMPAQLFRGWLPRAVELAVRMEHHGFALGTGSSGSWGGAWARAGMAVQRWAREQWQRTRSPLAWKKGDAALETVLESDNVVFLPQLTTEMVAWMRRQWPETGRPL